MPKLKAFISRFLFFFLFQYSWLSFDGISSAQQAPAHLTLTLDKLVQVTEITADHQLILADGTTVKLAGLLLPTQQDCGRLKVVCPLVERLSHYLQTILFNQQIYIASSPQYFDRGDRLLAQVKNKEGNWVQKEILEQGLGRIITTTARPTDLVQMLYVENQARQAQRGIWRLRAFQVLPTNNLNDKTDRFQIIEGTIKKTAEVRGTIYLNFGKDWRTDFTIKLEKNHRVAFANKGKDLLQTAGHKVRIRGWLFWENGPMISLYTPEQLEHLSIE
ncbi:thermonuclease family protein [Kiloniella sp.]|uniref:thermonuclease family protein n=1 Tax=Kiloniella sp. TaxID=1938587 RepID=UPI003A91E143